MRLYIDEGIGERSGRHYGPDLLREAKVGQLHVAVDANHHVLWLEVAEDHSLVVDVLERQRYLCRVDARLPLQSKSVRTGA